MTTNIREMSHSAEGDRGGRDGRVLGNQSASTLPPPEARGNGTVARIDLSGFIGPDLWMVGKYEQ